ncbi:hypothetical protein [uncultured Nostoc sp.]|uniref:hypothetical protein n=1 Tax=uncultured Nostoc sp. TaxID=340711 RepID=UPI0035CA8E04
MVAEVEKRAIAASTPLTGITKQQLAIEPLSLEPVKAGYYLADLRRKQFYYCLRNRKA